jgi:diacylglycerol kinase family enzyme
MRVAVVLNPASVTDADRWRADIAAALSAVDITDARWFETTSDDPGGGQARAALADGVDVLFVCGGDGTIRACADELAGTDVALGIVPSGTGNLVAANLGLPSDVASCVATAVTGQRRLIDLGRVDLGSAGGGHFALMAGMGFDAAMMRATPPAWKRLFGWPAYIVGGLRRILDRPMHVRIGLDGAPPVARVARMVLVANMGRMQGGVDLFGDARPDDGLLDVAIVSPRSPLAWLRLAVTVLVRRTPYRHQVETVRASTVDIQSRTVEPRQVDGDPIGSADRLTASIRPRALWVCVP